MGKEKWEFTKIAHRTRKAPYYSRGYKFLHLYQNWGEGRLGRLIARRFFFSNTPPNILEKNPWGNPFLFDLRDFYNHLLNKQQNIPPQIVKLVGGFMVFRGISCVKRLVYISNSTVPLIDKINPLETEGTFIAAKSAKMGFWKIDWDRVSRMTLYGFTLSRPPVFTAFGNTFFGQNGRIECLGQKHLPWCNSPLP